MTATDKQTDGKQTLLSILTTLFCTNMCGTREVLFDARLLETLDRKIRTTDLIDRRKSLSLYQRRNSSIPTDKNHFAERKFLFSMIGPVPFLMLTSRNFSAYSSLKKYQVFIYFFISEPLLSKNGQAKISSMNKDELCN